MHPSWNRLLLTQKRGSRFPAHTSLNCALPSGGLLPIFRTAFCWMNMGATGERPVSVSAKRFRIPLSIASPRGARRYVMQVCGTLSSGVYFPKFSAHDGAAGRVPMLRRKNEQHPD